MKKIFEIIWFCFILMIVCGCSSNSLEKHNEPNGNFYEDQVLDSITIKNFSIVSKEKSYISFEVENMTSETLNIEDIKISLYDKSNNLILESYGYVGGVLSSYETKHIDIDVDTDLSLVDHVLCERV